MNNLNVQFAIRTLAIVVALLAMNLAAALTTSRFYPRLSSHVDGTIYSNAAYARDAEGHAFHSQGIPGIGPRTRVWRLVLVECHPPPPNLLQVWSPILGGVAFSILVLVLPWWRWGARPQDVSSGTQQASCHRFSRWRWATIGVALLVLNLAGAVSRPPPPRSFPYIHPHDQNLEMELRYHPEFVTVIYGIDGSVIAYEGSPAAPVTYPVGRMADVHPAPGGANGPGETRSEPHMLRPPTHSFLELWWPVLASVTITVLVLVVIVLRALQARTIPATVVEPRPMPLHCP